MSHGLAVIMPQLSKLLLLLSSDRDREVVSAARAIGRVLRSNRLDWHDLVKAMHVPASAHACSDWHDDLAYCAEHMHLVDDRERDFLRAMAHWRGKPSQKQIDWLAGIGDRLRGAA
jgi:hypothetical protein